MEEEDRTINELRKKECEDYEKHIEKHEGITENTIDYILGTMNPNGRDED